MRAANEQREQPVAMQPVMSIEARKAAARSAAGNAQLPSIAALTYAFDAILTRGARAAYLRTGLQIILMVRGRASSRHGSPTSRC